MFEHVALVVHFRIASKCAGRNERGRGGVSHGNNETLEEMLVSWTLIGHTASLGAFGQ